MQIIGQVGSKEEAEYITQIAKFVLVGQRARLLGELSFKQTHLEDILADKVTKILEDVKNGR